MYVKLVVIGFTGGNLNTLFAYARKTQKMPEETEGFRNVKIYHRTVYKGTKAVIFTADDQDYGVILLLEDKDRSTMDKIGSIFFINTTGNRIPLENLVDI